MERGKNEQGSISISQRFRLLRDRLILRETPPVKWEEWKQTIMRSGLDGIPEELAPQRFIVSESFLNTFQEMLPIGYPGRIEDRKPSEAAKKARKGLEVARSLIIDASGNRLMVNTKDVGESELTANGARVDHDKARGEIGILHTHPKDVMPSSADLFGFLLHNDIVELVITPGRVIALFRTNKTPTFTSPIVVKGYLEGMGKTKGRIVDKSGLWILNHRDLNELHILSYEAERGRNVFVRKDNTNDRA